MATFAVPDPLRELAATQAGVVSRAQALTCGITPSQLRYLARAGHLTPMLRGTYAVRGGQLSRQSVMWSVVLRFGPDAVLSHETAAELYGLAPPSAPLHITMPVTRTPAAIRGLVIHRSARVDQARHPTLRPPRTTVEETIIDLTQTAVDVDDATSWLAKAVGARLITPELLAVGLAGRSRLRWRAELSRALTDVKAGCHSVLELRYLRDVERAHGLPTGQRQVRRHDGSGVRYDDVRYEKYRTVVELDGQATHDDRWRDLSRDNRTVVLGDVPLRYGYGDVMRSPCAIATQVETVLRARGWRGRLRRCQRENCVVRAP